MAKKAFESSPYSYNSETLTYSRQLASSSQDHILLKWDAICSRAPSFPPDPMAIWAMMIKKTPRPQPRCFIHFQSTFSSFIATEVKQYLVIEVHHIIVFYYHRKTNTNKSKSARIFVWNVAHSMRMIGRLLVVKVNSDLLRSLQKPGLIDQIALEALDIRDSFQDHVQFADVFLAFDGRHQFLQPPVRVG